MESQLRVVFVSGLLNTAATQMGLSAWHAVDGTGPIVFVMSIWSAALPFMLTVAGPQGIHGAVVFCGAK